jgi:hypothetical protein
LLNENTLSCKDIVGYIKTLIEVKMNSNEYTNNITCIRCRIKKDKRLEDLSSPGNIFRPEKDAVEMKDYDKSCSRMFENTDGFETPDVGASKQLGLIGSGDESQTFNIPEEYEE